MDHVDVNEVSLVGRLSAGPICKPLPSGVELVEWRLLVKRPQERWHGRVTGDSIACMSFDEKFRDLVAGWSRGDLIEARGALRRRVWRTPEGAMASRYDVEVDEAELVVPRPVHGYGAVIKGRI
jgi:single-strand DNA-binding protein